MDKIAPLLYGEQIRGGLGWKLDSDEEATALVQVRERAHLLRARTVEMEQVDI